MNSSLRCPQDKDCVQSDTPGGVSLRMFCHINSKKPAVKAGFSLEKKREREWKERSRWVSPSDGMMISQTAPETVKKKRTVLKDFVNMN